MAYKVFTNGSVLNASEMNEYLMNQSVITFSNSTARGSAITTPVEGMITYLEDTQTYESWDGAAWVALITPASSGNAIINGAFDIWQRGATFTGIASNAFSADRWRPGFNGTGVRTISRQTFTLGAAPVAGYEGSFFLRADQTTAGTGATINLLVNPIESVRTFAGQTVTLSFFAKANAAKTITTSLSQYFGFGGSPSGTNKVNSSNFSLTTSWTRFTYTVALDSLSGKTLGTDGSHSLQVIFNLPINDTFTIDIWGVQLEAGSTATDFRRNANSLQGELAACQRYYYRHTLGPFTKFCMGFNRSTTLMSAINPHPVTMRATPAFSSSAASSFYAAVGTGGAVGTSIAAGDLGVNNGEILLTTSGLTANGASQLGAQTNPAFIEFSSEL